ENDVQGEAGCPNMNRVEALNEEVEVRDGDICVNEQTPCSGKDLMGLAKTCMGQDADVGQDTCSLFGFDRQENIRVVDADAALSSEENKVTKYLFLTNHESDTDILFKSKSGQQSNRLQMESLGQDYVETNIMDTWAVARNFMEEYRSNDSPFRLFLPTFVVVRLCFIHIDDFK
nr:C2 calcium-dependent membrane targeting [Tanacetum cinerariifolium]